MKTSLITEDLSDDLFSLFYIDFSVAMFVKKVKNTDKPGNTSFFIEVFGFLSYNL